MGKITGCGTRFNWPVFAENKLAAAKMNDIQALRSWNSSTDQNPEQLRQILGRIATALNAASMLFKRGARNWSPDVAAEATGILPDLQNFPELQAACSETERELAKWPESPRKNILVHMAHGIRQSHFSPQQVETIRRIAGSGEGLIQQQFVEESDQQRMQETMRTAIYSGGGESKKTIKVVREILQNAVDAVVQKKRRTPETTPAIDIKTWSYGPEGNRSLDMMVSDNGIGMDWETLNDKFFRYFASGKRGEEGATGGFGIAKALIQETPKEGWFIETNGLHSGRFGKNVYMGTPKADNYAPPRSQIQKTGEGTTLTLLGLPHAPSYEISNICKKYSSSGIGITLDGQKVKPDFVLSELPELDRNLKNLSNEVSETTIEKEISDKIIEEAMETSTVNVGEQVWNDNGKKTSIKFAVNQTTHGGGEVLVYLNDQFQFERNEYLNKVDLICNVHTTSRPADNQYPVDPGRGYLRQPYDDYVREVVTFLRDITDKISKNKLFKDGLDITMFNQDQAPLDTVPEEEERKYNAERAAYMEAMTLSQPGLFTEKESTADELLEKVRDMSNSLLGKSTLTEQQNAIIDASVKALAEKGKIKIDVKEEVNRIIDGLTTPAASIIQKNFVAKDVIDKDPNLTASIVMLWQSILKKVMAATNRMFPQDSFGENKKYIPGTIFTNEALALYMSPQVPGGPHMLAVNPMSIAAIVEPMLFQERLSVSGDILAPMGREEESADTRRTADKLAAFLMHEAIHEMTHLLWPDYYESETDKFHKKISKVEMACHFIYPDVKDETKSFLRDIRKQVQKIIRRVSKSRDQHAKMSSWVMSQCRFASKTE